MAYPIYVCEGSDNAGKSTLAAALAKHVKGVLIKSERVPPTLREVTCFVQAVETLGSWVPTVCDRTPLISEPIYGAVLRNDHCLRGHEQWVESILKRYAIIYCRPPLGRVVGTINDREQMEGVSGNIQRIASAYDAFFLSIPQRANLVVYDYTQHTIDSLITSLHALGAR